MYRSLMPDPSPLEASSVQSPPAPPSKGAAVIDVAGMIRQASVPVKVDVLVRSGKRSIQLLSREKIGEIISRTLRNIVEKYAAAGTLADPATQAQMGAESKREFDDLVSQHEQTAKASDELLLSKQALDRELKDMRDDLAQQRAFADGRLPQEVERAMAEQRFEKLSVHLESMNRALGVLFSTRLYSFREIRALIKQASSVRKAAGLKAGNGSVRKPPAPPKTDVVASAIKAAVGSSRKVQPFHAMNLDLGRGLDVGTVTICAAARKTGEGTVYNLQRNAFLDVRDDAFGRKLLKYGIDYLVRGERGYIIGDPAFEFANIFEKPLRRPMREGMLCSDEPEAILIVNHLVQELLGPPQQAGEICCYSVPGEPSDDDRNCIYRQSSLEAVLVELGYTPRPVLESHLAVLAELKDQDYTGIGVSCGGGMVNVCLAYKSVPTLSFSTLRGGDWIDDSVAAALGTPAPLVCAIKEAGMDLMKPRGRIQEALSIYYRHFIQYTLEQMKRKLEGSHSRPTFAKPVPLVLAGGTAMIAGFVDLFRAELDKIGFPVEISEIRLAANPLNGVAEGCLQAALAETRALDESSIDVAPAALERAAVSGIPMADPTAARHLARLQSASSRAEGSAFRKLERKEGWDREETPDSGVRVGRGSNGFSK